MIMRYYKTIQVNKKQVRLHRQIMSDYLGRKLTHNELVHHKNGNIYDNTIENLEIVSRSYHKQIHPEIGLEYRFKPKYNFDKIKIEEMYKTMSIQQIADHYKCAIGTIHYFMKKNNLKTNKHYGKS